MPGIVGLITKAESKWAKAQLRRMTATLERESFYETGAWVDEKSGVYLGWTAQKNSFCEGMPLCNETGDVVLVFSGEEYAEPGIADSLKRHGHTVGDSESSYLVHLYEEEPTFPAVLNGRFHGLLHDRTRGTTLLFNDRYGMHRLYYHETREALYFSAEAKAILAVCPELRRTNSQSVAEFIACGCVLEDRTIFQGIQLLPAGSSWVFRNGSLQQKRKYFEPREWEEQRPSDLDGYYDGLREALSKNLPRYFKSRERISLALTGGMDTRVLMAFRKPKSNSLPCITFGGMFRDSEDVRVARRVAGRLQQQHDVIPIGSEFLRRFPHYAEKTVRLTEGAIDVYRAPDLYFSEKAREIAPVKMVGTYGSEILRQVVNFKPLIPTEGLYSPEILPFVHQAADTYKTLRREHPITFVAFRQSPWQHWGVMAIEQSQLTVRSPFLDNDFVRASYRLPALPDSREDVRLRLIREGIPDLRRIPTDRGLSAESNRLAAAARHLYLEFTFKAEYAFDYGMPQWLARVDPVLRRLQAERFILGRHKMVHFRVWYRDALADYLRQMLLDSKALSRPYLERRGVEAIVQGHLKGNRNYTSEIHKLLTLELLHRLFIDA